MISLLDIIGLMLFGAFMVFIASNKTARSLMSNASLPGMLAKSKEQKERVEARVQIGFLMAGIAIIIAAFLLLVIYLLR
jgi:uncharacterized sodium:solute symporter family permease YidK